MEHSRVPHCPLEVAALKFFVFSQPSMEHDTDLMEPDEDLMEPGKDLMEPDKKIPWALTSNGQCVLHWSVRSLHLKLCVISRIGSILTAKVICL